MPGSNVIHDQMRRDPAPALSDYRPEAGGSTDIPRRPAAGAPKECGNCETNNPAKASFCFICGTPFE